MRKIITLLLCFIMVATLAITVFATDSAQMSFQASHSTVHRGDTVTITVSLSAVEDCRSAGFAHTFNTSVFEFVSGSCTLSGVAMGSVNSSAASFAYGSGTAVSGQIFTYILRVKDSAPFGTYSVSGTANVRDTNGSIATSTSAASITVACNHSYGAWSKVDDNNHSRTCSICQNVETASHGWQAGTVTKAATCKEAGTQEYNCATCSGIKTEEIAKTDTHSYGNWAKVDDSTHKHVCSVCDKEETTNHTWNGGTVTKAATCKETGVKTYTCTACSATKTEEIAKTSTHTYGNWTKVNDTTHKHVCSVCDKEEMASHSWNSGTITKAATCKEAGVKTYTCACSATKTEEIAKTTTHTYGNWTKVDGSTHKHSCTVCGKEETASHSWNAGAVTKAATCKEAGVKTYTCTGCGLTKTEELAKLTTHTYDHGCDTDCNVCGQTRTTTHNYNSFWSADNANHWHACSVCGDKQDSAAHTPGAAATETTAQTCTVCGYILSPALGHTHNYATELTTDETGHWYACSGCNEKKNYADHDFENGCDSLCETCGYTRTTSHIFGEDWASDAENHWHECAECGEKQDLDVHVPGMEATAESAQICTVCGYELAPALDTPETEPTSAHAAEEPDHKEPGFPWWIVIVAVLALGGTAAFILIKKRKN